MKRTSAILLALVFVAGIVASAGAAPATQGTSRAVSAPVTITVYDSEGKVVDPATASLKRDDTIQIGVRLNNASGYTASVQASGLDFQKGTEGTATRYRLNLGSMAGGATVAYYTYKVQSTASTASFDLISGNVWSDVPSISLPSWTKPGPVNERPNSPVSLAVSSQGFGTDESNEKPGYKVTVRLEDQDLVAFDSNVNATGLQRCDETGALLEDVPWSIALGMLYQIPETTLYYLEDAVDDTRPSIEFPYAYSAQAAQDVSLALPLALSPYDLKVAESEPDEGGTVQVSVGGTTITTNPTQVREGSTVTLTATPAKLYSFGGWKVTKSDGTEVSITPNPANSNEATFRMPGEAVTVSATFNQNASYTIYLPFSSHGEIAGPSTAVAGSTVVITTSPHAGYMAKTVTVETANGASVPVTSVSGDPNKFSFEMPNANVTVSVEFVVGTAPTPTPTPTATVSASPTPTSTLSPSPTSNPSLRPSLPTLPPFRPVVPATAAPSQEATSTPSATPTPEPSSTTEPTMQPNGLPAGVEVSSNAPFEFVPDGDEVQLTGFEAEARAQAATVGDLAPYITLDSGMAYQVVDQEGDPVPNSAPLATGYMVEFESSGDIVSGATVIVRGDVLGTGVMSLSQLTRLAEVYGGTAPALEGPYLQAADFNADGRITLTDLVREAALYRAGRRD